MIDRFKIDGPTCISFSGGRTSAYMLWRVLQAHDMILPADAVVCFANTGKEHEATLRFVHDCSEHWGIHITWLEYQQDEPRYKVVDFDSAARQGEPFAALIRKKSYLPNPVARFCTEELKVKTINRYLKAEGIDADTMIGVRADEPRRVVKLRQRGLLVPLVDAGIRQADVQAFWKSQPFNLDLEFRDGLTALGNCDLCFLKGPGHIMGLIQDQPERAIWWAEQEQAINATFRSDRPSYAQMLKFSQEQRDMFDSNEEGISCFCGD